MLRSYDSPAMGGLQYPHRWGCVANTAGLKLQKSQGSRAEVRRMLQRLQPDRRGCFFCSRRRRTIMTSNSPVCYANIPSGTSGRTHTERYSTVQPAGFGKIGMTIEEAADYTGIGRNTLRRLVDWGKSRSCGLGVSP